MLDLEQDITGVHQIFILKRKKGHRCGGIFRFIFLYVFPYVSKYLLLLEHLNDFYLLAF